MMNSEERVPKEEPASDEQSPGYSVVINCYPDGTHDVFRSPLQPANEADTPDGLFGLESLEEALKGVIALKRQGPDYESPGHAALMQGYEEEHG